MASHPATSLASFGTPVGSRFMLGQLATQFAARRKLAADRSRIRNELHAYSDRQLSDLGLRRSDIEAVSVGRFDR